ncbi:hypothetical protein M8J76_007216 [Diaphorina citri]|nr:hypothetical protein M8J76_007216 [Diaphorina citri]
MSQIPGPSAAVPFQRARPPDRDERYWRPKYRLSSSSSDDSVYEDSFDQVQKGDLSDSMQKSPPCPDDNFPPDCTRKSSSQPLSKSNVCQYCDKSFKSERGVKMHIRMSHKSMADTSFEPTNPSTLLSSEIFCICNDRANKTPGLNCCACHLFFHRSCIKIPLSEYKSLSHGSCNLWLCPGCSLPPSTETLSDARVPCPFSPLRTFRNSGTLSTHLKKRHPDHPLPLNSQAPVSQPFSFKPTQGVPVSQIFSPESIQKHLLHLKSSSKTLRRIPKSARFLAADKLARVIENCLVSKSPAAFKNLLIFAHAAFDITSKTLISLAKDAGLEINSAKCEIFSISSPLDISTLNDFRSIAPDITLLSDRDLSLLGAPILLDSFEPYVAQKVAAVQNLFDRASILNSHVAYTLIKHCFYVPKFSFLLRTSPFWNFPQIVSNIDDRMMSTLEKILNLKLDGNSRTQACLPINDGGLGIRLIKDICLPAFLASTCGSAPLVSSILNNTDAVALALHGVALNSWASIHGENMPAPSLRQVQKEWDSIQIKHTKDHLCFTKTTDSARYQALQCKESNSWLHAIPSSQIGTLLDSSSFHTSVALRLGCTITTPFTCQCGRTVNSDGIHGLSCEKSTGRFSRHSELNDVIWKEEEEKEKEKELEIEKKEEEE